MRDEEGMNGQQMLDEIEIEIQRSLEDRGGKVARSTQISMFCHRHDTEE